MPAVLAVALVACNPDSPVPTAAITSTSTPAPAFAFAIRDIDPIPSLAPTSPSSGSWPLDPGDAVPPVSLQIIDPSNAVRLRPLLRLGLGTPSALAFDSSGERLAVGTRTGLISIYAAPAGILQQRWQAADREIMAMAFTGDGNHLLTGDAAGILSIWNPATAVSIATFDTGVRDPHQIAMAPDALVAAILTLNPVTNRSENSIWDVATGTLLHLRSSPFPVTALAPNGDSFAIGETDGAVEIFPVSGDGAISIESIHDGFVQSVALVGGASPRYVSAGAGRIQLQGYDLPSELSGWNSATRVAAITTSRDGRIVLTGDFTGAITLADLNEPSLTRISGLHRDRVVALALGRDGAYAATAALDGTVAIWPTTDPAAPTLLSGYQPPITALTFANDSTLVATHPDGSDSIWDIATFTEGSPAASSPQPASPEIIPDVPPPPGAIVAITASTDSTGLAVALASTDSLGTLALLDLATGRWTVIDRFPGFVIALAASNRFETIFVLQSSVDGPGRLTLRDGQTGELLTEFPLPFHRPTDLALSPDGRLLAIAGAGGATWLWAVPAN